MSIPKGTNKAVIVLKTHSREIIILALKQGGIGELFHLVTCRINLQ